VVEQGTHKPLVGGSNPPSATTPPSPRTDARAALAALGAAVAGQARRLIPDGSPLVVAVSGGADSMALLAGIDEIRRRRRWEVVVAHLDHALREGSDADAQFVAEAAASRGLPFRGSRVDVRALADAEHRSVEEAGREARYRFLATVARELSADARIATGHTADDNVETVLLNLLRGSGLAGLRGIPERRGNVVRPLLTARRERLRDLLRSAAVAWREDPSNADPGYARNRVRHELLPVLVRVHPGAHAALARFSRLASEDDELLDALAAAELVRRRADDADAAIDWHGPPPRALGRRLIRLALGWAPAFERVEALLDAAEGGRGGSVVELGGGWRAEIRRRSIVIAPPRASA
jgi:tRNA(Ile)-lysidine synthase